MPYVRRGKCVYKKDTGKKVGCSKTVEEAEKYLKALYVHADEEVQKTGISVEELMEISTIEELDYFMEMINEKEEGKLKKLDYNLIERRDD